jgi:hypothetical protein
MTMLRTCSIAILFVIAPVSALAQPGLATLITPASDVAGSTIAFTWQSAPGATWYHFWLGKANTSLVQEQWYTAEHAGCAGGGTCTITLSPAITAGAFIWHIRTWSAAGYGPWSPAQMFTVRDVVQAWSSILPASRRFTVVMNNLAVLDNETGLVWERQLTTVTHTYASAVGYCASNNTAGRRGWRVPSVAEITSLIEGATNPTLPAGHPFTMPLTVPYFWTQTPVPMSQTHAYVVEFETGTAFAGGVQLVFRVWCVRGGSTAGQ